MKPSDCLREGDDYLISWHNLGIGLAFTRVRETDASIRALVTPVQLGDRKRLLAPVWSNLFTLADRERIAKALVERISGPDAPKLPEWKDSIEHAFSAVIDIHTTPEPLLDLAQMPAPPEAGDLVWPILARNQVNVILADQGAGKSYVGLFLAACISANLPEALPEPLRMLAGGPVIYYDAETNWEAQRKRLERNAAALRLPRLPTINYRQLRPPLAQHGAAIRADVARIGAVFVVFDSLTFLAGGDLNTTEVSVPTMNAIGDAGDCTKLALAHHGKAGRRDGEEPSAIGSAAFEFKARSIWLIKRTSDADSNYIDQAWVWKKGNDAKPHAGFGLRLTFNETNTEAHFSAISAGDSAFVGRHTGTVQDRIRSALMETEYYKAPTNELAKRTGLSPDTIRRECPRMPDVFVAEAGGQGRGKAAVWGLDTARNGLNGAARKSRTEKPHLYIENDAAFTPNGGVKAEKPQGEKPQGFSDAAFSDPDELLDLPF